MAMDENKGKINAKWGSRNEILLDCASGCDCLANILIDWDGETEDWKARTKKQIEEAFFDATIFDEGMDSFFELFYKIMILRRRQTRLLKREIEILKCDAEDKTRKAEELEKQIDALEITIRIKDDKLKAAGTDLMATVPQCLDWLDREKEDSGGSIPEYQRETLRLKIQKYLADSGCPCLKKGGSVGTFYYVTDLARAFQVEYERFSEITLRMAFSSFAKYQQEIKKGNIKDIL